MAKRKTVEPTSIKSTTARSEQATVGSEMIFTKKSYMWMLLGAAVIAIGMILMISPRPADPNIWDESIMYGFRPTILAPIVILVGLGIEIYAIFKK